VNLTFQSKDNMKIETTEFYKVARKTEPKREHVAKREAWQNKAFSGRVQRDKIKEKQAFKLY
jgi:hypothetical protein